MLRRDFLRTAVALPAAAPFAQSAAPAVPLKLGIDSYSLRAWQWKAPQLIEYAASLKLDSVQLSTGEYESSDAAHLRSMREKAAAANIYIDSGIGSVCPTSAAWNPKNGTPSQYLLQGLDVAKAVGSKALRCFLGSWQDRTGATPIERHIEETVKAFRSVRSQFDGSGVKIALENHNGDLQAREVRDLIEAAGREYVGCCLDTGNPMWALEDPLLTLEILGPYAATTHLRDSVVFEHPRGAAWQWVALGDGVIDWKRFVARAAELCPHAPLQLENITGRPPRVVPFLEADFWKAFPKARAADFATFVALARRGRPAMEPMVVADVGGQQPAEYREALKLQQRRDLEKGIAFAKNVLGVGVNWRS